MQTMLAAFITTNTSGIPPSKANPIGRMFPPLFTINLPEEDQIVRRFKGHRRNANHYTSYIISCMCNCSYYNILPDF